MLKPAIPPSRIMMCSAEDVVMLLEANLETLLQQIIAYYLMIGLSAPCKASAYTERRPLELLHKH